MTENRNKFTLQKVKMDIGQEEKIYACWLDSVYWLSARAKYSLLGEAGSMRGIYNMSEDHVAAFIGRKGSERFIQHKKRYSPQKVWNYMSEIGISYTCCMEPGFPEKFAGIPDPPFGIFYKGRLPKPDVPAVAMIGARKCSAYGKYMAEQFAAAFAQAGVDVISGMARGIDSISQESAVKAGGSSYAVLGCGVDIIYPKENGRLYHQLAENGGILSEYPPRMQPKPVLFPPRNRIISALSDVVVVVEARGKSGTLITVDMALEQGKEVYAIPGRCTDELSMGCNRLLRQGAQAAVSPEDVILDMHWERTGALSRLQERKAQKELVEKNLSGNAKGIYAVLGGLPLTQDEIVAKLREKKDMASVPQICQGLVELELKGLVTSCNRQYKLSCL